MIGVTGSAPARSLQGSIIRDSLPAVELITLIAIVLIVGAAFRSVLAPVIALLTAGVAYVVTLRLSAYLSARLDLASPDELEPVVVALLLGVVTDYVIFFCSSLRDQTPRLLAGEGRDRSEVRRASIAATTLAIARSGPIVAVAGLAVTLGTATLLAAESPFFRALGPALAFTVTVGLIVAITLVPALMAILGDHVFWPSRRRHRAGADDPEPAGTSGPGLVGALAPGHARRDPDLAARRHREGHLQPSGRPARAGAVPRGPGAVGVVGAPPGPRGVLPRRAAAGQRHPGDRGERAAGLLRGHPVPDRARRRGRRRRRGPPGPAPGSAPGWPRCPGSPACSDPDRNRPRSTGGCSSRPAATPPGSC